MNSAIAVRNTTRFPYRRVSQPRQRDQHGQGQQVRGDDKATSVAGAPSDRPICGDAVVTIVPSSISMK